MTNLIKTYTTESKRHRTAYLAAGPSNGSLIIFIHGWPELSIVWRSQLEYFAAKGFRCVAPDMRGYGGSSVYESTAAYCVEEITHDMVELHDALGGEPAVWVGHDWGSPIVWSLAAHYAGRCVGVINMCVPYIARGFELLNLLPLIDRDLYPKEKYPVGQWDYFLYYREHFLQAAKDFEADIEATFKMLYRTSQPDAADKPAISSTIRARGGWFGAAHKAPEMERDTTLMTQKDFDTLVNAFKQTGFKGADAWYMNGEANIEYASRSAKFGQIDLPGLFLHAAYDAICKTVNSNLANPMREDCTNLTEVIINAGHELMLEKPAEVNEAIENWINSKKPVVTRI